MDNLDDAPYLCMSEKRCRLCQFGLEEGDLVVARIEYERFSAEFPLRMNETIHDDHEWINLHTCARHCILGDRRVPFFHGNCLWFRLFEISESFLAAGEYTFEPSPCEEPRRFGRIRNLLAPKLNEVLPVRLPPEVLTTIAGLLVHECAMITAEEQSLENTVSEILVDLSCDVYANYHAVDGVRYVKSLRNSRSETGEEDYHLLDVGENRSVRKIWIAEDHRGIRFAKFSSSDAPLSGPGPIARSWWREISMPSEITTIKVKTDVGRDIIVSSATGSDDVRNYISWASPRHPTKMINLVTLGRPHELPKRLRMHYFDCNAPGTTGYTVATNGFSIVMIHAHVHHDDTRFYKEIDASFSRLFFIHMPLDEGEYVTEIHRRFGFGTVNLPSLCLVFFTNRGRSTLFGTSGPPDSCRVLNRIYAPPPDGSRIYFNTWDSVKEKSIKYMAFDEIQRPLHRPFPSSLMPRSPYFFTQSNEPWVVSYSNMEGIEEVTLCRDVLVSHKPIIGMLLQYADGHRDCLGQFRFDKALESIRVDQSMNLHIGSRRTTKSFLYVADILTSPPSGRGELFWVEASWDGVLEWWSSPRHSVLRHTSSKGQVTNIAARI
ncbi:uncharacterized protein B0J16DRAFT_276889 [Fusarium flagelliforme]|uniref:uncharacterized protein n=1 Tax=Fusarium flagelliforme TaxID=2675880 RepID=UPI001E8DE9CD|nr:uncharacterized protein B0J16DRAFT_276889 [Fusarium flagelliforme]KAH7169755.1 hypothetical protein B0J16DRAFT_276889 [Fusarium flagelliforme]